MDVQLELLQLEQTTATQGKVEQCIDDASHQVPQNKLPQQTQQFTFDRIVGQPIALSTLQNAIDSHRIAPAYLFAGPDGVGKTLAAIAFINQWLGIANLQNHPDLLWIEPTYVHQGELIAATRVTESELLCKSPPAIRIDQIRKVSEFLSTSALDASFKVTVIQHADAIYPAAANALLKTLEQPITGILILISSNPAQLLPTVTSRCQKIPFFPLLNTQILQVLSQIGHTEIIARPEIIALANGSPGRAIYHYQKLRSLPPKLLSHLQLPPKDLVTALSIGKKAELLDFQQQLWLLEYLEYCWWHQLKNPTWLTKLDNAKNQLKQLAQPRLVWDILLMP
ncbi:AAA family ATPase [Chroococcidiopsis sp. FACHB-1243]|uniref:AAA family ATPase n=1 Tax=Chroococcidiopsis sp. [FACHB-1243] TaxID=2692781 RepID=UPI00177F1F4F|nr:AAA family ATPase [Chroococcidiopsis sp. [FACHB-1243]]MBD2307792.1 AAA family ATPase [Chroococcidiopsis sp. [FACHB-1243]]